MLKSKKPTVLSKVTDEAPSPSEPNDTNSGSKFRKRKVTSNWEKYERDVSEIDEQPEEDSDFKFLSENTFTTNYFQLAEEKEWEKGRLAPENSLFSLNVKQLTAGISCLPFYEILDIDKTLLLPTNIERCDQVAKTNVLRYRRDFPTTDTKKVEQPEPTTNEPNSAIEEPNDEDNALEDWLDSVLDN